MQKGFGFDVNKCTGCEACQVACLLENGVTPGISWRRVFTFNPRGIRGIDTFHHSLACNHCVDPPCLNNCPALAYTKDPETGAVNVDTEKCIGCRYCSWVCPFDAPRFDPAAGVIEKCTFCDHRLAAGEPPACAEACPTGALSLIDLPPQGDPSLAENRARGFVRSTAGPAFRFIESQSTRRAPDGSARGPAASNGEGGGHSPSGAAVSPPASRVDLRSEWTLLVFTFLEALLAGAYFAHLPVAESADSPGRWIVPLWAIALAGLAATGLSVLHLGRPARAWRAVLNLRSSWLSREIVLYTLFLAFVVFMAAAGDSGDPYRWPAAVTGAAALFATDRLYHTTGVRGVVWHSAQTLPTALTVAGLLSGNTVVFGSMCALKTILYVVRKYGFYRTGERSRPWLTRVRVLAGLAAPLLLWRYGDPGYYPLVILLVAAGEFVDRTEFYLELDLPSPARQMADDLQTAAGAAV